MMANDESMATVPAMTAESPQRETVKILLVDDKPENLVALEAVLEDLGQEIDQGAIRQRGLRACLEHDFAAILLDVKMPDMDGFETAAMIREREQSRDTPIIFLTALKSEEHLFRGYYMGAVDYLYKPIVPEVLRSKVAGVSSICAGRTRCSRRTATRSSRRMQNWKSRWPNECAPKRTSARLNAELERRVEERTRELTQDERRTPPVRLRRVA